MTYINSDASIFGGGTGNTIIIAPEELDQPNPHIVIGPHHSIASNCVAIGSSACAAGSHSIAIGAGSYSRSLELNIGSPDLKYNRVRVGQVDLLRHDEAICEHAERIDELEIVVAELRDQLKQLYYAPGMPGAIAAESHYAALSVKAEPSA